MERTRLEFLGAEVVVPPKKDEYRGPKGREWGGFLGRGSELGSHGPLAGVGLQKGMAGDTHIFANSSHLWS